MVCCSVMNCKNRSKKGGEIRFFSFPREETLANVWLRYCRPKITPRTGSVCSVHFLPSDYHKSLRHILMNESPKNFRSLKPDAIPSLHLNSISQPSSCAEPVIDISPDDVTKYIQADHDYITMIDCEELTNNSETSHSVKTQTIQTRTHCIETQTLEICPDTVTILASEYKDLITIKNKNQVINENLKQIFTPGQIRVLNSSNKSRIQWSAEDIAAAITFRSISPKGYEYMRNVVGVPLPGDSTLSKWASKFDIDEGIRKCDHLMQFKAKDFRKQRI